jgi:hypothetical protein
LTGIAITKLKATTKYLGGPRSEWCTVTNREKHEIEKEKNSPLPEQ